MSKPDADEIAGAQQAAARFGREVPVPETTTEDYSFVPPAVRVRAKAAAAKALECILATQLRVPAADGKGTVLAVWAQQNDALTLKPTTARNYEPEALASGESASVMKYLMSPPNSPPAVVRSVEAAEEWFEAHKIMGYGWSGGRGTPGGRTFAPVAGAGPLWARYYSLTTGKPIFGDRDKTIHDDVMELSLERRNGYAWYGEGPKRAMEMYLGWCTSCRIYCCLNTKSVVPHGSQNPSSQH